MTKNGKVTTEIPPPLEWEVQAAAVRALKAHPLFNVLFTLAGDFNAARRGKLEQTKALATGLTSGEPDLRLYMQYGVLGLIEYKVTARVTKEQKARHALLRLMGFTRIEVIKVKTIEDGIMQTMDLLNTWLDELTPNTPQGEKIMEKLIAANDNYIRDSRKRIGCPALARFIKYNNTVSARALIYWRDLTKPGDPYSPEACKDAGIHGLFSGASMQSEREMNKLLSPRELAYIEAAANDNNGKPTFDKDGRAHLGGLTFVEGRCTTPGVFNDKKDFGKIKSTKSPNGYMVLGEEAFSSSFEAELVRASEEKLLRELLGKHADVLDMAVGDNTARHVGEYYGYTGKTAERRGILLIDEAIAELLRINEESYGVAA